VALKELNHAFDGVGLEDEFPGLAARRDLVTERGRLLREICEQIWTNL
jgi:hypothetical protein